MYLINVMINYYQIEVFDLIFIDMWLESFYKTLVFLAPIWSINLISNCTFYQFLFVFSISAQIEVFLFSILTFKL